MATYSLLDKLDSLMHQKTRSNNVNDCLEQTLNDLRHLQTLTGEKYFNDQLQELKTFIKSLSEDQCAKWNLNKKKFDIKPVPIPTEPIYGILETHKKNTTNADESQLFKPLYSVRLFTDLEQARDAELASIKQWKALHDNFIQSSTAEDVFYHPAMYQITFQSIPQEST